MCGIGGFSLGNDLFDRNDLDLILNKISHRGPDDQGLYINKEKNIGLVHSRLSILDLSSNGHQPMISEDKNIVIVFNGEIYNFKDLRSNLIKHGYSFNSHSDTEVLLNLYLKEGTSMLSHLNGIFSFAIWDNNKKNLFLARDSFGVKPLYFSILGNSFYFASEIKALTHIIKNNDNLDHDALQCYLTFLYSPGNKTPFKLVKKLLPGEALIVNSGKIVSCWHWCNSFNFKKKIYHKSTKEMINETTNYLRKAIHNQLIADVPVGAFLSGGLDSSSIVALAKEKKKNIQCFTISSLNKKKMNISDDLPYAIKVANDLKVPLEIVEVESNQLSQDLEFMIKTLDEPIADPAALNVFYISQQARKKGIKVLLSGAGGDDIFTGYRRHKALQREYLWNWLPKTLRRSLYDYSKKIKGHNIHIRRLKKLLSGFHLDKDRSIVNYFRWISQSDLNELYSREFHNSLTHENADHFMMTYLNQLNVDSNRLDQMLALEQKFFLPDHNLLYTDKMSMAAGIEVRVPFLDKNLVNFANNLPNKFKYKNGHTKWILKKSMESYLPKKIIYRDKNGFGVPLRDWIKNDLRDLISDVLSPKNIKNRGLFESSSIQKLINDNDNGKIDASYTLFSLLCIEIWCKNFVR